MRKIICLLTLALTIQVHAQQDSLEMQQLGHVSYTGMDLNDIWGYATLTKEYALVGTTAGLSIVDVTNPQQAIEKHFIPGASSIWRDIKTWGHYAYVVHDSYSGTSDGLMIVDLSTIDSASMDVQRLYPTITVGTTAYNFSKAHNLYIDENGVLYIFGANVGGGGAIMYDVATDPENPQLLGVVNRNYYHDGMARGDTLWGAAIYSGQFEVIDVSQKSSPVLLAQQSTPFTFTHNLWISDDNNTLFTTDEKRAAPVAAYDVSNLSNIKKLDEIRTSVSNPDSVIPHNVHVKGDFLVTSYYTAGVQIVDASVPDILVETAYYDTSPHKGDGYFGAWGAYPFLPSGHILVSDIEEGLFILGTDYPRASFLDVTVKDSLNGSTIIGAQVDLRQSGIQGTTDIFGQFRDGQRDSGTYNLVVSSPGYRNDTVVVKMERGVIRSLSVALLPSDFSVGEPSQPVFALYPNPTRNAFNVELGNIQDPRAQVDIYDLSGKLQYRENFDVGNGKFRIEPGLPEGVYLMRIASGDVIYRSRRITVVR